MIDLLLFLLYVEFIWYCSCGLDIFPMQSAVDYREYGVAVSCFAVVRPRRLGGPSSIQLFAAHSYRNVDRSLGSIVRLRRGPCAGIIWGRVLHGKYVKTTGAVPDEFYIEKK